MKVKPQIVDSQSNNHQAVISMLEYVQQSLDSTEPGCASVIGLVIEDLKHKELARRRF